MFCLMYSMFISTHVEVVFGSLKNCQLCLSYFGEGIEASTQRINQWQACSLELCTVGPGCWYKQEALSITERLRDRTHSLSMIRLSSSSERVKVSPKSDFKCSNLFGHCADFKPSPFGNRQDTCKFAKHTVVVISGFKIAPNSYGKWYPLFWGVPRCIVGCWEHRQVLPHDGSDPVPGAGLAGRWTFNKGTTTNNEGGIVVGLIYGGSKMLWA